MTPPSAHQPACRAPGCGVHWSCRLPEGAAAGVPEVRENTGRAFSGARKAGSHAGDPVDEARQRLLRDPWPGARGGEAAGGGGAPHPQAQHRQPGAVRLRAPAGDPRGHDPQPAATRTATATRKGLLSARRAVDAALPDRRASTLGRRGHLPRQRRLRADPDVDAGAARQRRRGARPGARTTRCGPRRSRLAGGTAVHYRCDEQADWMPDLADIERKVTDRTKAIVIINPNNPTGAVYPREMLRGHRRDRPPARA